MTIVRGPPIDFAGRHVRYNSSMSHGERKLVFAPFGADDYGEDVLLFEHGLLFALETAVEAAGGFAYADIHAQTRRAGQARAARRRRLPEADIRALAARAGCDAFIDGLLSATRDPQTGALTEIVVSLRVFFPRDNRVCRAGRADVPGVFSRRHAGTPVAGL